MDTTTLYAPVQATLRENVFKNRGALSPSQLKHIGITLVDLLTANTPPTQQQAAALSQRGLSLVSLTAAIVVLHQTLATVGHVAMAQTVLDRLTPLVVIYNEIETATVRREQEAIREAVSQALSTQREEASRLEMLLKEVSTPVVPIYEGILVLPLIGAIDSQRANEITERLLESISQQRAQSIIIDITGVPVVDTGVAQHLLQTAQAARLLGASVILVGINPEMAQTMVQLGINVGGLPTLSNLQAGVRHALQQRGLAIRANHH